MVWESVRFGYRRHRVCFCFKESNQNQNKLKGIDVINLKLFLAKRKQKKVEAKENGEKKWLTEKEVQNGVHDTSGYTLLSFPGAELRDVGLANEDVGEVSEEDNAAGLGHIQVMVQVPRQTSAGKRTRGQEWFVDDRIMKKAKVDGDEILYFTMDKFPLIAHPVERYNKIMERDAYRVIFAEFSGRVKKSFETRSPANLVVTGNSGTGKSWFYLYCIFQLILGNKEEVEEFPAFTLVLDFGDNFQLYDVEIKEFAELNANEVRVLSDEDRVLRLVEEKSSDLVGWKGVSILFASPCVDGMNDYLKLYSCRYIMPVWNFEELQDCNSLLGDWFKVPSDVLVERYNKFGGIPRFIFTDSIVGTGNDTQWRYAMYNFSASKIISYVTRNCPVKDEDYSDHVLKMVPSNPHFRTNFRLDSVSDYVAEKIISKAFNDGIQEVSEFALGDAVGDFGCASV
ncbi:hypothetical protein P3T76_005766 [Phytophthora citrophthora]|uniref:Crinkler (CRN) family protein n=1 Tax=Phytophthora citrophthora TaxID=4793 RepID=A0AAD9GRA5_9STRA|nr:hypothetical protein P3T76_005766 [Phytophthora citrophthora]